MVNLRMSKGSMDSGVAITHPHCDGYEEVSRTVINTIANMGGIVCDGAKPPCAAKIVSPVDAAIMTDALYEYGQSRI